MDKKNTPDIEERKKRIEQEMEDLESQIDQNLHFVKDDISQYLNPKKVIRDYPLQSVGISIIAGLLAGRKKSRTSRGDDSSLWNIVWQEVKKDASKKLVRLILSFINEKTEQITKPSESEGNSRDGSNANK